MSEEAGFGTTSTAEATGGPGEPSSAGEPVAMRAAGIRAGYRGAEVLRGVDVELRRGEVVALLGPSGAGKSTFVQVLAGLLEPTAGTLELGGRVAAALQGAALARRTVRANLEAALGWWGVPKRERAARIEQVLTQCAAQHLADRPARELSGGEATRVHLARALMLEPDVLLLDEPFAALDPVVRGELLAEAGALLRSAGRATLVVVHDRAEAWALADRILVLLDGRIAANGPPAAVLDAPPTEAVAEFLGFSGRLVEPAGGVLRLRPTHARLVAPGTGVLDGTVRARVPEPDAIVVRVQTSRGRVDVRTELPGPAIGSVVGVEVVGGSRFPGDGRRAGDGAPGDPMSGGA